MIEKIVKKKIPNSLLIHKSIFIFVILFVLLGFIFNLGFVGQIVGTVAGETSFLLFLTALMVGMSTNSYKKFLLASLIVSLSVIAYIDYENAEWVAKIGILKDFNYYIHFVSAKFISFLIVAHFFNYIKIKFNLLK